MMDDGCIRYQVYMTNMPMTALARHWHGIGMVLNRRYVLTATTTTTTTRSYMNHTDHTAHLSSCTYMCLLTYLLTFSLTCSPSYLPSHLPSHLLTFSATAFQLMSATDCPPPDDPSSCSVFAAVEVGVETCSSLRTASRSFLV